MSKYVVTFDGEGSAIPSRDAWYFRAVVERDRERLAPFTGYISGAAQSEFMPEHLTAMRHAAPLVLAEQIRRDAMDGLMPSGHEVNARECGIGVPEVVRLVRENPAGEPWTEGTVLLEFEA